MTSPIVFNLSDAQDAQARLDEGVGREGDEQLAAHLEGFHQQEWDRFWEQKVAEENVRWLAAQCPSCVDGGSGEVCDEHADEPAEVVAQYREEGDA